MNRQIINKYINYNVSYKNVENFAKEVLKEKASFETFKVKLWVGVIPFGANGYTSAFKWKGTFHFFIFVNIYPYLTDKNQTNRMKWFYIYTTLIHEITHIKLLISSNVEWEYATYIALIEEVANIKKNIIPQILSRWMIPGKKSQKKIYSTSSVELLCNYKGLESAYDMFQAFLTEKEKNAAMMLLRAAQFLIDHIEIGYYLDGIPYNKFNKSIVQVQQLTQKGYGLTENYPQLQKIYTVDGKLKSMEKIFRERTDANKSFLDRVIFQMFTNLELDYSSIFEENDALKKHIEFLANQYCEKCIDYVEHIKIGTIFLERELLDDNALLLAKNVRYVNQLMAKYGMVHTGENLFLIE